MNITLLFDKNQKPSARKINSNPDLVQQIIEATSWLPSSALISERMWNLHHGFTAYSKTCKWCTNSITAFRSWTDGYHADFCSVSCQRKNSLLKNKKPKLIKVKCSPEDTQQKRIKTSLDRYGVEYPWQNKEIKNRAAVTIKTKTFDEWSKQLESFNVKILSPFSDYSNNRCDIRMKCLKCESIFIRKRFSNEHSDDLKHICPTCHTPKASQAQHEIVDFVRSLGVKCRVNDRTILKPYEIDIFIPEFNIGIEYDGLYWHSEKGRPDVRDNLAAKMKIINSSGVKVIFINEYEWKFQKEKIKSRLSSALGKTSKIFARKCSIHPVDKDDAHKFFNNNHIQGSVGLNCCFGLYLNGKLVAAMSFGKPRFSKHDFEILRFCSILDTTVVGAASKIFKHFIKINPGASIISYADLRWGAGNVYDKMGMTFAGTTGMSYFYVSKSGSISNRSTHQKHKLKHLPNFDISKTEKQIMEENGFSRFWTPGNSKWVFNV